MRVVCCWFKVVRRARVLCAKASVRVRVVYGVVVGQGGAKLEQDVCTAANMSR